MSKPMPGAKLLKMGLVLLAVGTGPLLLVIIAAALGLTSDPNPNPVGLGLLAALTFWPSVILIIFGLVRRAGERRVRE